MQIWALFSLLHVQNGYMKHHHDCSLHAWFVSQHTSSNYMLAVQYYLVRSVLWHVVRNQVPYIRQNMLMYNKLFSVCQLIIAGVCFYQCHKHIQCAVLTRLYWTVGWFAWIKVRNRQHLWYPSRMHPCMVEYRIVAWAVTCSMKDITIMRTSLACSNKPVQKWCLSLVSFQTSTKGPSLGNFLTVNGCFNCMCHLSC